MLLKCPECELQVSDKALACPHCGCPMAQNIKPMRTRTRHNKHRRLPNGFGQISEIKNRNLRKPFRAMVTVGKEENGRPICKLLKPEAYFETYNEAYAALVEYNRNPYDLDPAITMQELYPKWLAEHEKTLKDPNTAKALDSAWAYCSSVYTMRVKDVRVRHIKGCMENGTITYRNQVRHPSPDTQKRIKSVFNLMLDYALEYEMVEKNYARTFQIHEDVMAERNRNGHIPFSDEEIERLWAHVPDMRFADVLLIQCYSGWRPQELGKIRLEDVDLEQWKFIGGMKTDAGKDRPVPIHSKIRHLVEKRYQEACELGSNYLINYINDGKRAEHTQLTYRRYSQVFTEICNRLSLNPAHRPHDGRKHFVTMAKKYKVDEYAIKYIVGHAISDITEKVYTQREFSWLQEEIEKIK